MQWLGFGYTPARRTWYDFRDRIGPMIEQLHIELVQLALRQGHLDPTTGQRELERRMQAATKVLAERISQNAEKSGDKRKDPAKIQVSLTDPIAPLGRDKRKTFRPLYTV